VLVGEEPGERLHQRAEFGAQPGTGQPGWGSWGRARRPPARPAWPAPTPRRCRWPPPRA
jgi:hypothetical protein